MISLLQTHLSPRTLTLGAIAASFFLFLSLNCCSVEWFSSQFQSSKDHDSSFYVIVFDAGSTGTRIHVFHFERSHEGEVKLIDELFSHVEPGLSFYADHPENCTSSLQTLIKNAVDEITISKRPSTPLILKATAGLRLLPGTKAEAILQVVRSFFAGYDFKFTEADVSILDGVQEGYYGWITVNYLLGRLSGNSISHESDKGTVASMDLGGGSTQITFALSSDENVKQIPQDFLKEIKILGLNVKLYTHSYLGLGIMAARLAILRQGTGDNSEKETNLKSPCLPPSHQDVWSYGGVDYKVTGVTNSGPLTCALSIAPVISSAKIQKIPHDVIQSTPFYAFSYFFDRLMEAGLIPKGGGTVSMSDIHQIAQKTCREFPSDKRPFLCMDMSYIYEVLTSGYGFSGNDKVTLRKKIEGKEASWSLGAAFSLI